MISKMKLSALALVAFSSISSFADEVNDRIQEVVVASGAVFFKGETQDDSDYYVVTGQLKGAQDRPCYLIWRQMANGARLSLFVEVSRNANGRLLDELLESMPVPNNSDYLDRLKMSSTKIEMTRIYEVDSKPGFPGGFGVVSIWNKSLTLKFNSQSKLSQATIRSRSSHTDPASMSCVF